jgi:hypothetical protein
MAKTKMTHTALIAISPSEVRGRSEVLILVPQCGQISLVFDS